jgi:hypothetical protein
VRGGAEPPISGGDESGRIWGWGGCYWLNWTHIWVVLSTPYWDGLKRRFEAENGIQIMSEAYQLGKKLSNSERIFNRSESFSVRNRVEVPGPVLIWGFPRVPNCSWHPPGTVQPAFRQAAATQISTQQPGNTPANPQTVTRLPGNTSQHTLRQWPGPPATYPGTPSNLNPAPQQCTRRTLSHSHTNPALWQDFPAHTQTLTQNGTHFPRIPGMALAVFPIQHGNKPYLHYKNGNKMWIKL